MLALEGIITDFQVMQLLWSVPMATEEKKQWKWKKLDVQQYRCNCTAKSLSSMTLPEQNQDLGNYLGKKTNDIGFWGGPFSILYVG